MNITVTNSNAGGVTVTVKNANGGTEQLYKAPRLMAGRNTAVLGYKVNLNYVTAVTLHTPSTLDTSTYTPPPDYTVPYTSKRAGSAGLGRVMFMGDSITHGVNDKTWRWQLFKILVDNGIEAEIVGPRSGYTPGYARLATRDIADNYGGVEFPNVHLAQSSGRTHNIITGSNAGMTGVNYGGHSTGSSADAYNCNTWFCLMGTNDLLSDRGYTEAEFCVKMQRLLGGKVSCKKDKYTWSAGDEWGTMSRIATDVLKDANDVLYIMSVPCWGHHNNNNEPARHLAVQQYNDLLQQWVSKFSKKSGLQLRYVDINEGMVDPTHKVPFSWPDSMSNRPGRDGLHPNEQGSLIMAGNLAQALGIAGRTAGLPRISATTPSIGKAVRISKDSACSLVAGKLGTPEGFTVTFPVSDIGNATLRMNLSDGTNGGTLSIDKQRICWEGAPLYCAQEIKSDLQVTWHPGQPEKNIQPGIYVWLGDMLIGQALTPAPSNAINGIHLTAEGKSINIRKFRQFEQALAPVGTLRTAPTHAYTIK